MATRIGNRRLPKGETAQLAGQRQRHRPNLEGAEGAIVSIVIAEAEPALHDPAPDADRLEKAREARRNARKRLRAVLPREEADAIIARAQATALDLSGIAGAPEQVRRRLIACAVTAIRAMAEEGISSTFDRFEFAAGMRTAAIGLAMQDKGLASLDLGLCKAGAYQLATGNVIMARARASAREREAREGGERTPFLGMFWPKNPTPTPALSPVTSAPDDEPDDDKPAPAAARVADAPTVQAPDEAPAAVNVAPAQSPPAPPLRPVDRVSGVIVDTRTRRERLEDERRITEEGMRPKPLVWTESGWRQRTEKP